MLYILGDVLYVTHQWEERVLSYQISYHIQQKDFGWGLGIGDVSELSHSL